MGCCESVAISVKSEERSVSLSKKEAEKNRQTEAAKVRRADQTTTENVVHEEFERDIIEFYRINDTAILGEGISGSVKLCTHLATGTEYALKSLDKSKLKADALNKLRQEIRIMAKLDHPNILRLHECFEDGKQIHLVLELCTGGELLERLHQQAGHHYTEKVACQFIKTMVGAVRYCHENGIVHRDLKLENFLFENCNPDAQLKLIDFGLSDYFQPNEVISHPVGTPYYVAPEVLGGAYDARCDIWSIGVITYMLLTGTPPFYGKNDAETLKSVRRAKPSYDKRLFGLISAPAVNFIQSCLTKNTNLRPSAAQLQQHEWFKLLLEDNDKPPSLNIIARLQHFQKKSALVKLCMEVVAHTLSSEQIQTLRKHFQALDVNHTGEITYKDLKLVMSRYAGISEIDLKHIFSDEEIENGPENIKYHQFLAATLSRQAITDNNLRVAFEKISKHHDYITVEDLQDMLGKDADTEEVEQMMHEVNMTPTSGKITFAMFKNIMKGGEQSPMVNSPMNKFRKKLSFHGSPVADNSGKRDSRYGGNSTPLHRRAVANRMHSGESSATPTPTHGATNGSPKFNMDPASSPMSRITPSGECDSPMADIPPPPRGPPPSP